MKQCCAVRVPGALFIVALLATGFTLPLLAGGTEGESAAGRGEQAASNGIVPIAAIALTDTAGKEVVLGQFMDQQVLIVFFIGTECPVNNAYMRSLKQLHAEFAEQGVRLVAINSNRQDSAERVAQHAREHALPFPVLIDADQQAADALQAERTPEAFLLDDEQRVRYRGRIDDQFGVGFQRPAPTRHDLAEAVREVLAGKTVTIARAQAAGCLIGRSKPSESASPATPVLAAITYSNQIARLFENRCVECHREGRVAPFALTSYAQSQGWAEMIREVVTEGRMPPWHADPRYGQFSNDRRLLPDERETLLAWIDGGCPEGNPQDLPTPKEFVEGWTIGEPDVILTMTKPVTVPAKAPKGGIPYRHVIVPTRFEHDVWVQAAEARPGNRAVVHHVLAFIRAPGDNLREPVDKVLVGHAPGDQPLILPRGVAMRIAKGSDLIFQMHYTANGVEQTDQSSVGLIFAKEPPQHIAFTRTINNYDFVIPPGASNYVVHSSFTFPKDGVIVGFMPHMHLRGKSFQYEMFYPDGRSEIVLSVPRYDFNWQSTYRLVSPLAVPAGTKVACTGTFDNSAENPNNPDPTQEVRWGDQTWEEMMGGLLDYYYVEERAGETAAR